MKIEDKIFEGFNPRRTNVICINIRSAEEEQKITEKEGIIYINDKKGKWKIKGSGKVKIIE